MGQAICYNRIVPLPLVGESDTFQLPPIGLYFLLNLCKYHHLETRVFFEEHESLVTIGHRDLNYRR